MTVLTTFAANSSAADARDTLNKMLSDIAALMGSSVSPITLALSGAQTVAEGQAATFTVTRSGDTSRAVDVDYTTQGTGTNPVTGADHAGGSFPAGRITIAAGATTGQITVAAATDNDNETAETGALTITSPTAGVTISPGTSQYTFTNVSAGGGDTIVYGPQTTADSGYVQTNGPRHKLTGKLADASPCRLTVSSDATGANALLWDYIGFGQWKLYAVTDGAQTQIIQGNVSLANTPDFAMVRSADRLSLTVAGASVFDIQRTDKTGTYARYEVGGGQTVTITRLA